MVAPLSVFRGRVAAPAAVFMAGAMLAMQGIPSAYAQGPEASTSTAERTQGLAVLAVGSASDAAWPLAQGVYTHATLRPAHMDEAHARVLAGEAPAADAPKDLRDLAEVRAAVHGDDAPSRQLLNSMAKDLHVRGIVVVDGGDHPPSARVYLPDGGAFDAARYVADANDGGTGVTWSGAVQSLVRSYGSAPATATGPVRAPAAAVHETPRASKSSSKSFYESPWFWGAVGAAVFAGGAVFFATRDSNPDTVHLQMQVPR